MRPTPSAPARPFGELLHGGRVGRAHTVLAGTGFDLSSVDANGDVVEVSLEGPPEGAVPIAHDVADRIHRARPDLTVRVSVLESQIVEIPGT
jgi:hypothetical protein